MEASLTFTSWRGASDDERWQLLFSPESWQNLTQEQRTSFLDEADWQDIRKVPAAKAAYLRHRVTVWVTEVGGEQAVFDGVRAQLDRQRRALETEAAR